jgi:hypothetical protein
MSSAFPSKYLKAADLQDRHITVTMSHVAMEKIAMDSEEVKPVLYFEHKAKGLVLNKTNSETIARVYGDESDQWLGKPIILYSAMVQFKSEMVEAVRIKIPKQHMPSNVRPIPEPSIPPAQSPADYGAEMDDEIPW